MPGFSPAITSCGPAAASAAEASAPSLSGVYCKNHGTGKDKTLTASLVFRILTQTAFMALFVPDFQFN
jgi:hypothetical protein